MAVWNPPTIISPKELVGRRAFGSKVFEEAENRVLHYKINVFLDEKVGTGLSVDRLGVRSAQGDVLEFLCPLCEVMADKGGTKFVGWAQISVADVVKSIGTTDAVGEINPYHAEIDRSSYPNIEALRAFAFQLCTLASKHEFVSRPVAA